MEDDIVCRSDRWEDAEYDDFMEVVTLLPWQDTEEEEDEEENNG